MVNLYTSAHSGVDSFQSMKKQFVNLVIRHSQLNSICNKFIDSQTKYTKEAIDNGIATMFALTMAFANAQFYNDTLDSLKLHTPNKGE